MSKKKRFAALKMGHLRQAKAAAQQRRRDMAKIGFFLESLPKGVRERLFAGGMWWAWGYELPIVQHLILFFYFFGLLDQLRAALGAAEDKTQAVIDFVENYEPDDAAVEGLLGPDANEERRAVWLALFMSLLYQIECLGKESCYLSDLVEKVRKGGLEGDEAFLRALHVDRTIVSCPTFGERITRAALNDEKLFFRHLGKALEKPWKKPSPKKKPAHKELRLMLQALHETGQLQKLSITEADELFIRELGVYSDEGEDPARSLQRFILRFKNNK